jgi:hypothetical protein
LQCAVGLGRRWKCRARCFLMTSCDLAPSGLKRMRATMFVRG